MTVVSESIAIDVPPEELWEVLMDPQRLGEWVTIHRRLGEVSEVPLRCGSTIEQTLGFAGAQFKVHWRVVELDAPRLAVWEGRGPARSTASIRYELTPDGKGATQFDYRNEFRAPGGVLGAAAGRVLVHGLSDREARRSLTRLKRLLESGSD
jgi:carbon monoxide dehydrogenase subunit G